MKHTKLWFILILLAVISLSCEDDDYGNQNPTPPNTEETNAAIAKANKNPHSIENMEEKALGSATPLGI